MVALTVLSLACGAPGQQLPADGGGAGPGTTPPTVSAPAVKYSFYEPSTEEGLQKDTNYGRLIAKVKPGFRETTFGKFGLKVLGRISANGATYYLLHKEGDVLGGIRDAKKIAGVVYVEPEMKRQTKVDISPISYDFPDTYTMSEQWGAHAIKALDAWRTYGFGPNRPVVADVDTGVRFNHEDFQDGDRGVVRHAFSWFGPASNAPIPMGNFPFEDPVPVDYKGHASITNTDYSPGSGHGSHTAGTIGAVGNNGKGVAGVCWNIDLVSYKGLYSTAEGTGGNLFTVYASLWHLVKWKKENQYEGTIPVNMSLGGLWASAFEIDMIEYALQNGIMVIAAAGNDGQRLHGYPSAYAGVLGVGATNGGDSRALFSSWGNHISVVAPGQGIISTYGGTSSTGAGNGYASMSGTSMAAPHVTGLAGYMLTFNPDLKPDEIKTYIERNADYVDGATGFTEEYGWGRINVLNTIRAVVNDLGGSPPSDYVYSQVRIKLPNDDVPVYLYQCDQNGGITNYVASAISGISYSGIGEGLLETGMVSFNMLRPNHYYVAKAYFGGEVGSTDVFPVRAGQAVPQMYISFNSLKLQTLGTQDYKLTGDYADTEIWLYDSESGEHVLFLDYDIYDTMLVPLPIDAGDYWIRITEWFDREYDEQYPGEYALYVTTERPYQGEESYIDDEVSGYRVPTMLAPGAFAAPGPDGVKGAQAQTRADAQPVAYETLVYGRFNGDPAASGTSGATGHYYRIVVEEE
jgi:thermitase